MIKLADLLTEGTLHYGCVMLYFNIPQLQTIQNHIDQEDLYIEEGDRTFGLEDEPHITLLYGLHEEVSLNDVKKVLNNHTYSECAFFNVSLFEQEKYDVLKFDVKGPELQQTNKDLRKFPYTSDFDKYHPHSTIAYIKAGRGKKYEKLFKRIKFNALPSYAVYSKADHTKTKMRINIR